MTSRWAFASFIALVSFAACATTPSDCDFTKRNDLWLARTSGTWKAEVSYGFFRVLIFRKVGDAAMDTVCVDVLQVDEKSRSLSILRRDRLTGPGYSGNVVDVHFFSEGAGKTAVGIDILMKGMDGIALREVYVLATNSAPRRLVQAKFADPRP